MCRFDNPRSTCLVYSSGSIVITGAQTVYCAIYDLLRILNMIRADYPDIRLRDINIRNMTATLSLGGYIDLGQCARDNMARRVSLAES